MSRVEVVVSNPGEDAQDFARMLREMYDAWDGDLSHEAGVHRFVRVSPFDPEHRRCTCFAQVSVGLDHGPDYYEHKQVRSYILDPYERVVDHRLGIETPHARRVLTGELGLLLEQAA